MTDFNIIDLSETEYAENGAFARGMYTAEMASGGEFTGQFSTGLYGVITAGYGRIDVHGYFEYPLEVDQDTQHISVTITEEI